MPGMCVAKNSGSGLIVKAFNHHDAAGRSARLAVAVLLNIHQVLLSFSTSATK